MNLSEKIEMVRTQVFSDFGPHVELGRLLSLIWQDEVVDDYLRQSGVKLRKEYQTHELYQLIYYGIWHFLTTVIELDGSETVGWSPETPEFLRVGLMKVHNDDAWRFQKLEEMTQANVETYCECRQCFLLDIEPDESMEDLVKWFTSDTRRHGYIQEAEFKFKTMGEGGLFVDLLQIAQVNEIDEMGKEFIKSIDEMAESLSQ